MQPSQDPPEYGIGLPDDDRLLAVGRRARELRESAGLLQSHVAEQLGISQPVISKYERGFPPLRYVFDLCELLQIPVGVFFAPIDLDGDGAPIDDDPASVSELATLAESLRARLMRLASADARGAPRRVAS